MSFSLAITVTFEQPTYSVSEELITVQPVLVFSNPSQSDITVQVMNTDVSTSGKFKCNYTQPHAHAHTHTRTHTHTLD